MKINNMEIEAVNFIEQNKNKFLNIAVLVLMLVVSINIYRGQIKVIRDLNNTKESEIKKNEALENLVRLQSNYNMYKKTLNSKDISLVISNIGNIAKASAVNLGFIRPEAARITAEYSAYPFVLSVSADSFHNIGKFIANLERQADAYVLEEARIGKARDNERGGDGVTTGRLYAELKLYTFLLPE